MRERESGRNHESGWHRILCLAVRNQIEKERERVLGSKFPRVLFDEMGIYI